MMIGSGGAVAPPRREWVVTPPTLGVGLLEFHQLDRMVEAGRAAARALLASGAPASPTSGPGADRPPDPEPEPPSQRVQVG